MKMRHKSFLYQLPTPHSPCVCIMWSASRNGKIRIIPITLALLFSCVAVALDSAAQGIQEPPMLTTDHLPTSKLDVHMNIELSFTHGGNTFNLGSSSSPINSKEQSCEILNLVYLNKGINDATDTIMKTMLQMLCSEMDEDRNLIKTKDSTHNYPSNTTLMSLNGDTLNRDAFGNNQNHDISREPYHENTLRDEEEKQRALQSADTGYQNSVRFSSRNDLLSYESHSDVGVCFSNSTAQYNSMSPSQCWKKCQALDIQFLARHRDNECHCYHQDDCLCLDHSEEDSSELLVPPGYSLPEKCDFDTVDPGNKSNNSTTVKQCKNDTCVCDSSPLLYDVSTVVLYGLFYSLSGSDNLLNFNSPQYQAACWILNDDPLEIDVERSSIEQLVQRYVLAVLYFSTTVAGSWKSENDQIVFMSSDSECKWTGIDCSGEDDSVVTNITLQNMNLKGTIPTEISHLRRLEQLVLNNNEISGTIPEEIGMLSSLLVLSVRTNNIKGSIPEKLFDARELRYLFLSENKLLGVIPRTIGSLTNLIYLSLGRNKLSGSIPDELWNLTKLQSIWLGMNEFTSALSSEIKNQQDNLKYLWLESCRLKGTLPTELGLLSNLEILDIRDNSLTGTIPPSLSNLTNLKYFYLQQNQLTGNMPDLLCENDLEHLEADCSNKYFDPSVNCTTTCCSHCTSTTNEWQGLCPDAKIVVSFTKISAILYDSSTQVGQNALAPPIYVDIDWMITNTKGHTVLSDKLHVGVDLTYSACVASTDCFEFHIASEAFNDFAIDYKIQVFDTITVGGEEILKDNIETKFIPTDESFDLYEKYIAFGYNNSSSGIAKYKCDVNETICGEQATSSSIEIYNNAVEVSGKRIIDDTFSPQYNVMCGIIKNPTFAPGALRRHYIISLFNYTFKHALSEWQQGDDECDAKGIRCNNKNHVTHIDLSDRELHTSLLPELGQFPYLEELIMPNSGLTGSVPESFSNLWSLTRLDLSNNEFNSSIPNLPMNLEHIDLSNNSLTGQVPSNIGETLQLENLNLSYNKLTQLPPFDTFHESKLKRIYLHQNNLEGTIGRISNLKDLEYLDLSVNFLSGSLPDDLLSMPTLLEANFSKNFLRQHIPTNIADHSKIRKLDLSQNFLLGAVPTGINKMVHLEVIMLQDNQLVGTLPTNLGNLTNLKTMRFDHNELVGAIPSSIDKLINVVKVHLHANKFEGQAPVLTAKNVEYITDCGSPSSVPYPVVCYTCTMCCNSDRNCQKNPGIKGLFPITSLTSETLIYLCSIYGFIFLLFIGRKWFSLQRKEELWEGLDMIHLIGESSIYLFFLSVNKVAYLIAIFCSALQMGILFLFISAVRIQDTGNDWEYTISCPPYNPECANDKATTKAGWSVFALVVAGWLIKDLINSSRLVAHALIMRCSDGLFAATTLLGITLMTVYTSILYNRAIATTNTQLIVNAVILLFVTDLDEKVYELMLACKPQWVEKTKNDAKYRAQIRHGMISKIAKSFKRRKPRRRNSNNNVNCKENTDRHLVVSRFSSRKNIETCIFTSEDKDENEMLGDIANATIANDVNKRDTKSSPRGDVLMTKINIDSYVCDASVTSQSSNQISLHVNDMTPGDADSNRQTTSKKKANIKDWSPTNINFL